MEVSGSQRFLRFRVRQEVNGGLQHAHLNPNWPSLTLLKSLKQRKIFNRLLRKLSRGTLLEISTSLSLDNKQIASLLLTVMISITSHQITLRSVGRYDYPDKRRFDLWYRCPKRSCTVYLAFEDGWKSEEEVRHALNAAIEKDICAIKVTRIYPESIKGNKHQFRHAGESLEFSECQFKPYQPHFNSDFVAVDYEELTHVKELKSNVMVVSFDGEEFAYKFMTPKCYQNSFETEVANYKKLEGVEGIPRLKAIVRKAGLIQGLLMSYIEGIDLWSAVQNGAMRNEEILFDITYRIIRVAANLEQHKFYHVDLKCSNIVRRDTDGEIYFIDFGGGWTDGMYREERFQHVSRNGPDTRDALFTLGRTIWELWTGDHPFKDAPLDRVKNDTVCNIIRDCDEGNVDNIAHLYSLYCPRLN